MRHHTKDKGDLGLAEVIADLLRHDYQVCLPISEHLPFDLIGVSPDGVVLKRIQVKYKAFSRGAIEIDIRATGLNAQGVYYKSRDLTKIDAVAAYCPDTDAVYYIRSEEFNGQMHLKLRFDPPKSKQTRNIRFACDYIGAHRVFLPE